ncbi:MAG: MerC domain-containing protein [Bryobacterales bacterium]|nr:MerC domain-containing protein [Bryobacterales bacterium]
MSTVTPTETGVVALPQRTRGRLDRIGMVLSSTCALHCVLMPFVVGYLTYLGHGWIASESTEFLLLGSTTLVALGSLLPSYLQHRNLMPIALFALGLGLIVAMRGVGVEDGVALGVAMLAGGTLIVTAHWRNHKLCACCHTHDD